MGGRDSSSRSAIFHYDSFFTFHSFSGEYKEYREHHIKPNNFLYIQTVKTEITIKHTGTHVDLFE